MGLSSNIPHQRGRGNMACVRSMAGGVGLRRASTRARASVKMSVGVDEGVWEGECGHGQG